MNRQVLRNQESRLGVTHVGGGRLLELSWYLHEPEAVYYTAGDGADHPERGSSMIYRVPCLSCLNGRKVRDLAD